MRLTEKQERFCQEIVKGNSQYEAFISAGYSNRGKRETIDNNAYMLSNKSEIKARIEELKKPIQEKLERKLEITVEKLVKELEDIKNMALAEEKRDYNSTIKAIQEQGKLTGLYTEKKIIEGNLDISIDLDEE